MARFSGQIRSVKYIDQGEKTIEVLYGEDPNNLTPFILSVDYNNPVFQELLEEVTIEEIEDQTKLYYTEHYEARDKEIHNQVKEMFDVWIQNAQKELDRQDAERYEIFERYKEKGFQEIDDYKDLQQREIDKQVEERYAQVDDYKDEQEDILRAELKNKYNISAPSSPLLTPDKVVDFLFEKEDDEDTVFKMKLAVFNKPEVKNHKDRPLKMKVRKAKTIPELFAAYQQCLT